MFGHARATMRLAVESLALVAASFLALGLVGGALAREGLAGVVLSELLCVGLPAALWLRARLDRASAGLASPRALTIVGGALVGLGAFYLMGRLEADVIERLLPTPRALKEQLERLVVPPGGPRPLAVDVLGLAVVPALCEELLFRGALMGAILGPRPSRTRGLAAVAIAALAFGAFHGSPYRVLPAALMGLPLGLLRLVGGTLWPAMAMHAINNALVVILLRHGLDEPPASVALFAGAALSLLAGFAAARTRLQPR